MTFVVSNLRSHILLLWEYVTVTPHFIDFPLGQWFVSLFVTCLSVRYCQNVVTGNSALALAQISHAIPSLSVAFIRSLPSHLPSPPPFRPDRDPSAKRPCSLASTFAPSTPWYSLFHSDPTLFKRFSSIYPSCLGTDHIPN